MPLTFRPKPGNVVICDYAGFKPPEMVKVRPVVVLSPRHRSGRLVTIVPISSTPPAPAEPWHVELAPGAYPPARAPMWVKADLINTVAIDRLDRVMVRDPRGTRTYQVYQLDADCMAAIQAAVKAALGFP